MDDLNVSFPKWPITKGKQGKAKLPPDGQVVRFENLDEIRRQQSDYPEKVIYLEKFQFEAVRVVWAAFLLERGSWIT